MDDGLNSPPPARSAGWVWIPVLLFVLLCWPVICCCCLAIGAAGLLLEPSRRDVGPIPTLEIFPPVVTVPAVPLIPTKTPGPASQLDPQGVPLFGSASLQPGFVPDPYIVEADAGGSVDTRALGLDCGVTSYHPAFVFELGEGTSESFLRVFFQPEGNTGTTLLVHTPDGEWLCAGNSPSGDDPSLDLDPAAPGDYAIWLGVQPGESDVPGDLYITASPGTTP